jgi:hypothetical protein
MKTDDFEKRLQQVAPRNIPAEWRLEVLRVARARSSRRQEAQTPVPASRHGLFAEFIHRLSLLSRPHRAAWAGLAAVWVLIMALNLSAHDRSTTVATSTITPPSPQVMAAWRAQYRELAALTDPNPPRAPEPARNQLPQPRSSRRDETVSV